MARRGIAVRARRALVRAGVPVVVAGAACAPPRSPNRTAPVVQEVVRAEATQSLQVTLNRAGVVFVDSLRFDAARAWSELPSVYRALGLPVNEADPGARRIAVNAFQPQRIDGQRLSRFLDCGRGVTAGEYADNYQVYLSVETRVIPVSGGDDPAHGTLQSRLSANARPRAVNGNPVPCQTLGRLERRIVELLQQRLAAAAGV